MKYGKVKGPKCKTGAIPGLEQPAGSGYGNDMWKGKTVTSPMPGKPGGQGPSGTHGSYSSGSKVGTVKNK